MVETFGKKNIPQPNKNSLLEKMWNDHDRAAQLYEPNYRSTLRSPSSRRVPLQTVLLVRINSVDDTFINGEFFMNRRLYKILYDENHNPQRGVLFATSMAFRNLLSIYGTLFSLDSLDAMERTVLPEATLDASGRIGHGRFRCLIDHVSDSHFWSQNLNRYMEYAINMS